MRVEQAVYGEIHGRGHGLRTSSTNAPVVAAIASKLDLPDVVPPGVQAWSPFVRGFPIDDHYVVARTFLDSSASRGGMVLTHALIVSLEDMCEVGSLAVLFRRLAASVAECPASVVTLELDNTPSSSVLAADLIGTANALTASGLTPVVRLSVAGFEQLVDSLWKNLWPALRRSFAFRLSFGPNDLVEKPTPTLVCTPEKLQVRWTKHLIVKSDDETPNSESAGILCGRRDVQPILDLAEDLGLAVHTLRELSRLERLQTLLSGGESFDELLAAIRLADGLSNQPTFGVCIKDRLIGRFTALIPGAGCKQLMLMRNLALPGFASTRPLWSAVELLVGNLEFSPADDSVLTQMIAATIDEDLALPLWCAAVKNGLSAAARRDKNAIYLAIWRWAEHNHSAFSIAVDNLPADATVEQRLAGQVPRKLTVTSSDTLLSPMLKKCWLTAYGAVLAATLPPIDATGHQLKVDKDLEYSAGLRSALRFASPTEALDCALVHKDLRLVGLCAEQAAVHPEILSHIRCEDITEQQLWGMVIVKDVSLWNAPSNAIGARDTVLDLLIEGLSVDTGLLKALAKTPLADLSATSERARLWSLLPASQREHYLQATATGWLEIAEKGSVVITPEAPLEQAILASANLRPVLERSSAPVDTRLAIICGLPSFSEDQFIAWLKNVLRGAQNFSHAASEQLGTLVSSRHWDRAAKYLSDRLGDRPDIKPGLRLCAGLLPFYTRWMLGITKLSAAEKWRALEDEARQLYPSGPDSDELWSRAGGKNSDLLGRSLNGATRWHTALNSIRSGGRPTASDLLKIMCQDFPMNEKLRLFVCDADIVG
ncbi:effector-associated domain EAD1-containing protein [Pseudomonas sp. AMR01]|uniref:GAP1-N1 domain-containing protein n=1 Tax=Pseudomonas sp. AMR01 TaxID=3064904 RepID=UPI0035BFEA73